MSEVFYISTGAAVGADGAATINADSSHPISGLVTAIFVKYTGDKPATADVVIKTKGTNAPSLTLLTLTNGNTDGCFFVRGAECDLTGVATGGRVAMSINDFVNISVAQTNTGDIVEAWLMME